MKTTTRRFIFVFFLCSYFLLSCGTNESKPEYLLIASSKTGCFTPADYTYFAITDGAVNKISESKYGKLTKKAEDYKKISKKSYSFNAKAKSFNPSEWEFEQDESNDTAFDIDTLKNYLFSMNTGYFTPPSSLIEDTVNIVVTEFDKYAIIEADLVNKDTVKESKCAIFHNGENITSEDTTDICSVYEIYENQL